MKKLLLLLFIFPLTCFSQMDTIVTKKGKIIPCAITYVNAVDIYFKENGIGGEIENIGMSRVLYYVEKGKKVHSNDTISTEKKNTSPRHNTIIDFGINRTGASNNIICFSAKNAIDNFGVSLAYIGKDENSGISDKHGQIQYEISREKGNYYGGSLGVNYCLNKIGVTFSLLGSMVYQKTIIKYYNSSVSSGQNNLTSYSYSDKQTKYSFGIYAEYDFLRKFRYVELGIRAGYDNIMQYEVGAFLGLKLERRK